MKMSHYIIRRGTKYYLRARFPKDLVQTIGRKEFKKSLKTDSYQQAVKNFPQVMQEFTNIIERAERRLAEVQTMLPRELTDGEVMVLVSDWYKTAKSMYQHNVRPREITPELIEQRNAFLIDTEASLKRKKEEKLAFNQFDTIQPIVQGILKRAGTELDKESQSYHLLCHTVLRAWVNLEEQSVERLKGNFGFQSSDNILDILTETSRPIVGQPAATLQDNGRTLSDLIDAFKDEFEGTWKEGTALGKTTVFKFLKAAMGKDKKLSEIDRVEGRRVFVIMQKLPKYWSTSSKFEGLSIDKIVAKAEKQGLPLLGSSTINLTYLSFTKPLFDWAVNEQWMDRNPFVDLIVREPENEKKPTTSPFTPEQLRILFSSSPWNPRDERPKGKPSHFWAPLISLYHGCRVGEVAGLLTKDIYTEDGIPIIHMREHKDVKGKERTFKNKNANRVLPVHPELIKMGFLRFAEEQAQAGHRQLFPEESRGKNGKWGRNLTKWFIDHLKDLGIKEKETKFHSFRHNCQDALREAGLHGTAEGQALAGRKTDYRSANLNADTVADAYGTRFKARTLKPHIDKVGYPGLDLSHLYVD